MSNDPRRHADDDYHPADDRAPIGGVAALMVDAHVTPLSTDPHVSTGSLPTADRIFDAMHRALEAVRNDRRGQPPRCTRRSSPPTPTSPSPPLDAAGCDRGTTGESNIRGRPLRAGRLDLLLSVRRPRCVAEAQPALVCARGRRGAGFVLQQVSLGTGRLAPSVATVSVANPVVSILIGVLLLNETLSRPTWHIVVAVIGLGLALAGAVVISLAHEAAKEQPNGNDPAGEPVAAV